MFRVIVTLLMFTSPVMASDVINTVFGPYDTNAQALSACNADRQGISSNGCTNLTNATINGTTYQTAHRWRKFTNHSTGSVGGDGAACTSSVSTSSQECRYFVYNGGCLQGQTVNATTGICEDVNPCTEKAGTTVAMQFPPNKNVVCNGGCSVSQSGDSTCTGTAAEGGYCVADFTYSGAECPAENSDESSQAPWTGTPDPAATAEGGGTDGTTKTGTGTSQGTSTTTDNGDGTTTTTSSGTSETTEEEKSNGTASASGKCDLPPSCSGGDPQLCAILRQQWNDMCSGDQVKESDFADGLGGSGLDDYADVQGSWWSREGNTNDDSDAVSAAVSSALTSPSSGGACSLSDETFSLGTASITFPISKLCTVFDIVRVILHLASSVWAALIIFQAVTRS